MVRHPASKTVRQPLPGDPFRYTSIAHAGRAILGPISSERLDALVHRLGGLGIGPGSRVVDLGCGRAELLIRMATRLGATALGVDWSPWHAAEARARARSLGLSPGRLRVRTGDADRIPVVGGRWDCAVAVGAAAGGQVPAMLDRLVALTRSGGLVVFGDIAWASEPPDAGLTAFGMTRADYPDVPQLPDLLRAAGTEPLHVEVVSAAEWRDYEGAGFLAIRRWADAHPGDPDLHAFLARADRMRESFTAWRSASMGFALALARKA